MEIKNIISLTIAQKHEILSCKSNKTCIGFLYAEKYAMLMKKIKQVPNK